MGRVSWIAVGAALLGLGACAAPGPTEGGASSALIEVSPDITPLASFDSDSWQQASESCEDQLDGNVEFQIVSGELLVALDNEGIPICTDSVENVQDELAAQGRRQEAREIGMAYLLAVGLAVPGINAGDPSPQPSMQEMGGPDGPSGDGIDEGDPSPQPS